MKKFLHIIIVFLCSLAFFSCEKSDLNDNEPQIDDVKYVQFYANPQMFSRNLTGLEIHSITINNVNYTPKTFVDNCTESILVPLSGNTNGSPYLRYKINMKNYSSLDAIMNNLPFTWEYWQGIVYHSDIKNGCNTLQVVPSGGTQLYAIVVK